MMRDDSRQVGGWLRYSILSANVSAFLRWCTSIPMVLVYFGSEVFDCRFSDDLPCVFVGGWE